MAHTMLLTVPPADPPPSSQDVPVMIIVAGVMIIVAGALFVVQGVLSLWALAKVPRRTKQVRAAAAADGWVWWAEGYTSGNLPFEVFHQGHGRGCDNVLSIPGHPRNLRAFDFWCFRERVHGDQAHRQYRRFSAASIELGWMWPDLTIRPENLLTRAAKHVGLQDIQFESDTFNRMYQVLCADRRFASALIDAAIIDLLVAAQGRYAFEISGRYAVAVADKQVPGAHLPAMGRLLEAFADRIPATVYELYPVPARPSPQPVEAWGGETVRPSDAEAFERPQRLRGWDAPLPGSGTWRDPNPGLFGGAGGILGGRSGDFPW